MTVCGMTKPAPARICYLAIRPQSWLAIADQDRILGYIRLGHFSVIGMGLSVIGFRLSDLCVNRVSMQDFKKLRT